MKMKYLKLFEQYNNESESNFKKWFGDSKTVKDGNPIVYYHGTDKNFKRFSSDKIDDTGFHGRGFYFYNNDIASEYYGKSLKCYLRIEKPFYMNDLVNLEEIKIILGDEYFNHKEYIDENIDYGIYNSEIYPFINNDRLIELGYDGIIHGDVAVVFDNKQIKSINNKGSWSSNSDNIYENLTQYVYLQRGQHGSVDSEWDFNVSNGQNGEGVYSFFKNDQKMIEYYTANGEELHTFKIDNKYLVDLSKKNLDYWGAKQFMYNNPQYKAFVFKHEGHGIPTSKEVVITDPEIIILENGLYENYEFNIGDKTNFGIVTDITDTQVECDHNWISKRIVKPVANYKKNVLHNRKRIDPNLCISAFANPIEDKMNDYAEILEDEWLNHSFPPIKGFPNIINRDDIGKKFMNGEDVTEDDIGKYVWILSDGHHRVAAAIKVNLPYLETKLDPVYMGDETDYSE